MNWSCSRRQARLRNTSTAVWAVAAGFGAFPHYIGYFNTLIGGHEGGRRITIDSNVDWGQDLPAVKDFVDAHGIDEIQLAYFGTALPQYYGIVNRPVVGDMLWADPIAPGDFSPAMPTVVSDHLVPHLRTYFPGFRQQVRIETIGGSMAVYGPPENAQRIIEKAD